MQKGVEVVSNNLRGPLVSEARDQIALDISALSGPKTTAQGPMISYPPRDRCKVPGCLLQKCKLLTHQTYVRSMRQGKGALQRSELLADALLTQLETCAETTPSVDGVDGLPKLPLDETLDPDVRSLFHYFFTKTFDKLAILFRGPSVAGMNDFKERMLATALSSEAYCRSLILQAQTEIHLSSHTYRESKESLSLNNDTLTALRKQIASIHQSPDPLQIELALLVLCILVMYDMVHNRVASQRVHWQGMRELVAMRGGMHHVTTALAYVLHADRSCAIVFEEPPTYTTQIRQSVPIAIPIPGSLRYGTKFQERKQQSTPVDQTVIEYLADVSGLVELWEEQRAQALVKRHRRPVSSLEYLHFARDRLDEQFAVLNARWARIDTIERCLLWTCRVVEYPCTWANYVRPMTRDLCHKLATALHDQSNLTGRWPPDKDTMIWMLFSLAVADSEPEDHAWAFQRLLEIVGAKYGVAPWPRLWWADEQENLIKFVWSSSFYAGAYRKICDDLEGNVSGTVEVDQKDLCTTTMEG